MDTVSKICPKCGKGISEVEYYKYHLRCKDCWNKYCRSHRYYNKDKQKECVARFKIKHFHENVRTCKCCGISKVSSEFEPKKHYCKLCWRSPAEIKLAYQRKKKPAKFPKEKAIKVPKIKAEKPIKIKKEKPISKEKVTREVCKKTMTDTRVFPRVRDVRKGWDRQMELLRAKFKTT